MKAIDFDDKPRKAIDWDDDTVEFIEIPINGIAYRAVKASTGQIGLFYAGIAASNAGAQLREVFSFLEKIVEPQAYRLLRKALEADKIEVEDLTDLAFELVEASSGGNPTGSSTSSSRSRQQTGGPSKASSRPKASTRASSRPRASAE